MSLSCVNYYDLSTIRSFCRRKCIIVQNSRDPNRQALHSNDVLFGRYLYNFFGWSFAYQLFEYVAKTWLRVQFLTSELSVSTFLGSSFLLARTVSVVGA